MSSRVPSDTFRPRNCTQERMHCWALLTLPYALLPSAAQRTAFDFSRLDSRIFVRGRSCTSTLERSLSLISAPTVPSGFKAVKTALRYSPPSHHLIPALAKRQTPTTCSYKRFCEDLLVRRVEVSLACEQCRLLQGRNHDASASGSLQPPNISHTYLQHMALHNRAYNFR